VMNWLKERSIWLSLVRRRARQGGPVEVVLRRDRNLRLVRADRLAGRGPERPLLLRNSFLRAVDPGQIRDVPLE